jgi:hypothetical protein
MSRRQAILETLLIFAVFCLQGAWPVPEVNEPCYLGKAIHFWNPHWASSDWFLQTADTHAVFYVTVGWLALLLKPTALAWTIRLLTWALLAWSWQRLSAAVVPRAWASIVTATLFVFLLQHYNVAGEWVVGGAEAKGFSFALIFFALEGMVQGRWNRMWILLGCASALHILVGGWAAIAAGIVWIATTWKDVRRSTLPALLIAPTIAFLLALPGLVPSLLMNRGTPPAAIAQANQINVFERLPHHLNPLKFWNDGFVLPFLLLVVFWLCLWPTAAEDAGARRLRAFTAISLAFALVGTGLGLLSLANRPLAASWLRFYWFRLVDVAVPLGLTLLAARWLIARKMRVAIGVLIAVTVFHLVDCVVLRWFADPPFAERQVDGEAWRSACFWATGRPLRPLFPRQPRADKLRDNADWHDVCRWVSEHTPPDARFLIPRSAHTFKWYAARGEVVNWKEMPQDAAGLVVWWTRIQDIYATGNPPPQDKYYISLADAGAERLKLLAAKYQADYLVTQTSEPMLPMPVVYKNEAFAVYEMK